MAHSAGMSMTAILLLGEIPLTGVLRFLMFLPKKVNYLDSSLQELITY